MILDVVKAGLEKDDCRKQNSMKIKTA